MARRPPTRRTAEEWQDAFYSLDERNRHLQQKLNEREQELKLMKVLQRRNQALSTPLLPRDRKALKSDTTSARTTGTRATSAGVAVTGSHEPVAFTDASQEQPQLHQQKDRDRQEERSVHFVSVPSTARKEDAAAAAAEVASAWSGTPLPDPSMVWGMENSIQNYVTANALYHTNEELRQRLEEAAALVKTVQHDLATSRALTKETQSRLENATQQIHQLVRERDLAVQKLTISQQTTSDLERNLQNRATEEERIRFALESQITELRSRLVLGADNNELLTRDVRTLLTEVKEKSSEAQALRSKLTLAEAALSSQKHNNENLLVELRSLNSQLINERKRLLSMTREAQLANLRADELKDMEARLSDTVNERNILEREHVQLMESLVGVTESALRQAREEVRHDIVEWRAAAAHWEDVSKLLYKDIAQRTQGHIQCREECEEAKRDRDEASMALREAWEELKLCRAKLDIVWPTHRADTHDLNPAEILATFGNYRAVFRHHERHSKSKRWGANFADGASLSPPPPHRNNEHVDDDDGDDGEIMVELCNAPLDEQVRELHEANSALLSELTRLQMTNELQAERLRTLEGQVKEEREALQASAEALQHREEAGQQFLQTQLDRVSFLEAQVHSLRGYDVSPNMSLRELAPGETVFELFLGQILSTETPEGVEMRNAFPPVFCSVDFLLHETVTTPIVTGLNAFLDTTVSFCVAMDALLQLYLQSRELLVQLHRVRSQDEIHGMTSNQSDTNEHLFAERLSATLAEGSVSMWPILADEKTRNAQRPTLRGHIPLFTTSGKHIASVEFSVTVRTPFSEPFRALVAEAVKNSRPMPSQITPYTKTPVSTLETVPLNAAMPTAATTGMPNTPRRGGMMQLVRTPQHMEAVEHFSTSSSSGSLLDARSQGRPSGFTLVPRVAAVASVSASPTVHTLVVDVCKLQLPHELIPVPRLSCFYALAPLGRDVYLHAPPTPRYEYEYLQDGGGSGTSFPIASLRELLAVTREPFILFFFDESSSASGSWGRMQRGDKPYWAVAMTEWRLALERPEEYVSLELPLMSQSGSPVHGAVVRVRLLATSKTNADVARSEGARETAPTTTSVLHHHNDYHQFRQQREQHETAMLSGRPTNTSVGAIPSGSAACETTSGSRGQPTYGDSIELEMIRRQLDR